MAIAQLKKAIKKYLQRLKTNKRSQRHLLIAILAIIFLLLIWWAYYLYRHPSSIYTKPPQKIVSERFDQIKNSPQAVELEKNQALKVAKMILAHFNAKANQGSVDSRGFYGDERLCNADFNRRGLPVCQAVKYDLVGNHEPMASFRSTVQLLWARYRYYLASNDQEQLRQLILDVDNLVNNVLDSPSYVLQNQDFNCLLMRELYFSPLLDEQTKAGVARICNESNPEMHPESAWEYDQFHHPLYYIDDFLQVAMTDKSRHIPDENRTVYQLEDLQAALNKDLLLVANGGVLPSAQYARITSADKLMFLRLEANAALDYLAASEINQADSERQQQSLIEYFLVTKETLNWLLTTPNAQYNDGACLVGVNIRAYLEKFAPDLLSSQQLATLRSKLPFVDDASEIDCLVAGHLLFPEDNNVKHQFNYRLKQLASTYSPGMPVGIYMYQSAGFKQKSYYYPTVINTYLAALLSNYGMIN